MDRPVHQLYGPRPKRSPRECQKMMPQDVIRTAPVPEPPAWYAEKPRRGHQEIRLVAIIATRPAHLVVAHRGKRNGQAKRRLGVIASPPVRAASPCRAACVRLVWSIRPKRSAGRASKRLSGGGGAGDQACNRYVTAEDSFPRGRIMPSFDALLAGVTMKVSRKFFLPCACALASAFSKIQTPIPE